MALWRWKHKEVLNKLSSEVAPSERRVKWSDTWAVEVGGQMSPYTDEGTPTAAGRALSTSHGTYRPREARRPSRTH